MLRLRVFTARDLEEGEGINLGTSICGKASVRSFQTTSLPAFTYLAPFPLSRCRAVENYRTAVN